MGDFKIPSILYYGHDGSFRGVKGTVDDDEAESLHEMRWYGSPTHQGSELMRSQVEVETFSRRVARDRQEAHDCRFTLGQISPRRLCGFHSLPVRFHGGFHQGE